MNELFPFILSGAVSILAIWIDLVSSKKWIKVVASVLVVAALWYNFKEVSESRDQQEQVKRQLQSSLDLAKEQITELRDTRNDISLESDRSSIADSVSLDYLQRLEVASRRLKLAAEASKQAAEDNALLNVLDNYLYRPKAAISLKLNAGQGTKASIDSVIGASQYNKLGQVEYVDLKIIIAPDWEMSMHRWGDSAAVWAEGGRNDFRRDNPSSSVKYEFEPCWHLAPWEFTPDAIRVTSQLLDSINGGPLYFRFQPGNVVAQLFVKYNEDIALKEDSIFSSWERLFSSGELRITIDRNVDLDLVVALDAERGRLNGAQSGIYMNWLVSENPRMEAGNRLWRVN